MQRQGFGVLRRLANLLVRYIAPAFLVNVAGKINYINYGGIQDA